MTNDATVPLTGVQTDDPARVLDDDEVEALETLEAQKATKRRLRPKKGSQP